MKIDKIIIEGGQTTFAERVNSIKYIEGLDLSSEQLKKIKRAVLSLDISDLVQIKKIYSQAPKAINDECKNQIGEKIKKFMIENGQPIAHGLSASALFEVIKLLI